MKKYIYAVLLLLSFKGFSQFSQGNLVIYRVGDGTAPLSTSATPVFLDEYTPTGKLVQSLPMPTKVSGNNKPLVACGTAVSEGFLNRSTDKQYLTLTGYAQEAGTGPDKIAYTKASDVNRVVGVVDYRGNVNTTTVLADYASGGSSTSGNPRSVASDDGNNLWIVGATGGVRYTRLGGSTSKLLTSTTNNIRFISIFDNQLYASIATTSSTTTTTRITKIGTGLPTTGGQVIDNLSGIPNTIGSPCQYMFFDLNPNIPGMDVLYVADEDSAVFKYSLTASNQWVSNGAIGNRLDYYRGLTGVAIGNTVALYAIRKGGSIRVGSGGELVLLTDASGHNGTFAPTPVVLATAGANTVFRGIAFAPEPIRENAILPVRFDEVKAVQTNGGVQIGFTNKVESDVVNYTIERSVNGREFEAVAAIRPTLNNGGEATYSWIDKATIANVIYYRIKGEETNGKILYSTVVKINTITNSDLTIYPNPVQGSQLIWSAGLSKGVYKWRIINMAGQILFTQTFTHMGGNTSQTVPLPATVKSGRYTLQIVGEGVQYSKNFIVQ